MKKFECEIHLIGDYPSSQFTWPIVADTCPFVAVAYVNLHVKNFLPQITVHETVSWCTGVLRTSNYRFMYFTWDATIHGSWQLMIHRKQHIYLLKFKNFNYYEVKGWISMIKLSRALYHQNVPRKWRPKLKIVAVPQLSVKHLTPFVSLLSAKILLLREQ